MLEHCSQAITSQRLKNAVPDKLHSAVPEEFTPRAGELFEGSGSGLPAVARELVVKLSDKSGLQSADEIDEWLVDEHDGVDDSLEVIYLPVCIK